MSQHATGDGVQVRILGSGDAFGFIGEACFFEKKIRCHLDYRTLCEHRARLGCRRLILTHMGRDMRQHLAEVDMECAADGLTVHL